ncbi:FecR family protein [Pedobacter hiemivivus]|uniref:FecR family protein n=1 Tax=Pedobacter hiemivivus TaxID=2530454 RepID=A0A4R0MYJ7_9SPHI|nr:FecR family protein [Pedobacter hiemivivus]TCC91054.1 FecR family protein [Pedobacter hiemivivus]
MEHSKQDLDRLIDKYLSGEATSDERNLLEQSYMKASSRTPMKDDLSKDARFNKIGVDSWESLMERINRMGTKRSVLWPRIAAAAAIFLVVGVGVLLYRNQTSKVVQTSAYTNDVAPGSSGATLTLASGKRIVLSDAMNGELAKEAGLSITKTADGQLVYEVKDQAKADENKINTLSTANGETYHVRLPDGSLVALNAASSLTYATSLNEGVDRRVKLVGEAYFEVFKDKKRPFIVESKGQEVEVLGTHFNINAYTNEPNIKTTLLEGSVRVTALTKHQNTQATTRNSQHLTPGQQSIISNGSNTIKVENADTEEAIAWKNGYFNLNNENIAGIMRKLSRWYDLEVEYRGKLPDVVLGGEIPRNTKLSQALKILEVSNNVHFIVEGKKIIVTPNVNNN